MHASTVRILHRLRPLAVAMEGLTISAALLSSRRLLRWVAIQAAFHHNFVLGVAFAVASFAWLLAGVSWHLIGPLSLLWYVKFCAGAFLVGVVPGLRAAALFIVRLGFCCLLGAVMALGGLSLATLLFLHSHPFELDATLGLAPVTQIGEMVAEFGFCLGLFFVKWEIRLGIVLRQGFWRSRGGDNKSELHLACRHEAGHALAASALGLPLVGAYARAIPIRGEGGACIIKAGFAKQSLADAYSHGVREISMILAGVLAECQRARAEESLPRFVEQTDWLVARSKVELASMLGDPDPGTLFRRILTETWADMRSIIWIEAIDEVAGLLYDQPGLLPASTIHEVAARRGLAMDKVWHLAKTQGLGQSMSLPTLELESTWQAR